MSVYLNLSNVFPKYWLFILKRAVYSSVVILARDCWQKENWDFTQLYNLIDESYWHRWCVHSFVMDSLKAFY